jgi:lipoprotein NlpI
LKGAIADLTQSLQLDPTQPYAFNNLGLAFADSGNPKLAIMVYDKAIELGLKDHVVFYNRGKAREKTGDRVGAREDMLRSAALVDGDAREWLARHRK